MGFTAWPCGKQDPAAMQRMRAAAAERRHIGCCACAWPGTGVQQLLADRKPRAVASRVTGSGLIVPPFRFRFRFRFCFRFLRNGLRRSVPHDPGGFQSEMKVCL